jgi:hypothetical protein
MVNEKHKCVASLGPQGEVVSYYNCNLFNKEGQFRNQTEITDHWLQAVSLNLSQQTRSAHCVCS